MTLRESRVLLKTVQMYAVRLSLQSDNEHSRTAYEQIDKLIASFGQQHFNDSGGFDDAQSID